MVLGFHCSGLDSIPGWGTRSLEPHCVVKNKQKTTKQNRTANLDAVCMQTISVKRGNHPSCSSSPLCARDSLDVESPPPPGDAGTQVRLYSREAEAPGGEVTHLRSQD